MKKYIFLLFLLCGCVAVFAQQKSTFTVSGQVLMIWICRFLEPVFY